MELGHFYFLLDQYYIDFPDPNLMKNKDLGDKEKHDRPFFYAFKDDKSEIFWLIPVSSQVKKFRGIYDKKVKKYGECITIIFKELLGVEKAFLIQNMCPVVPKYIQDEYISGGTESPVRIKKNDEEEIRRLASKALAMHRQGVKLLFPNVLGIEEELLKQIHEEEKEEREEI